MCQSSILHTLYLLDLACPHTLSFAHIAEGDDPLIRCRISLRSTALSSSFSEFHDLS